MSQAGTFGSGGSGGSNIQTITPDAGAVVTPLLGNVNAFGGSNINTFGAGETLTINLNETIVWPAASATESFIQVGTAVVFQVYGTENVFIGANAGNFTLTGTSNTALGYISSGSITTGSDNCSVGSESLTGLTTGDSNTAVGTLSLELLDTGSDNISIGYLSGSSYTGAESSNILVGHVGVTSESNTIRVGTHGTGSGLQNRAFMAGIVGVSTSNSQMVTIDSTTGQLGAATIPLGGGIETLNGDYGSATGSTVTVQGGYAYSGTLNFVGSGSTLQLKASRFDNNGRENIIITQGTSNGEPTGVGNTALGWIGFPNGSSTTGNFNSSFGYQAFNALTSGSSNACFGQQPLLFLTTGSYNLCIGAYQPGVNYTGDESSNILIGNPGVNGEYNVIRIGEQGTGNAQQDECYIAGIAGVTTSNSEMVTIDTVTGQLGSTTIPSGGGFTWVNVTGTSQSMSINTGYIANNGSLVTMTLPATAAVGSVIEVAGNGSGGWSITQNSGQTIHFGNVNTTTGVGGSLSSTNRYDSLQMVCTVANTDFVVKACMGNITFI